MTQHSLAQIGVDTEAEADDARADVLIQTGKSATDDGVKDYFIERNGLRYAGSHFIIDMWNATGLDDEERVQRQIEDDHAEGSRDHGTPQRTLRIAHLARDVDGGVPSRVRERDPDQGDRERAELERDRLRGSLWRVVRDLSAGATLTATDRAARPRGASRRSGPTRPRAT